MLELKVIYRKKYMVQTKADKRQTISILAKRIELLRQIPDYSFERNNNNKISLLFY